MKIKYKILLLSLVICITLSGFNLKANNDLDPNDKDKLLLEILTFVLEKHHYSHLNIDDEFSKGVYKDFIQNLDPSKRFFIQSDIDEFSKYEIQLDDQIKNKDLTFFNLAYTRLVKRMNDSKKIYEIILQSPFDFTVDETLDTDYATIPYAKNAEQLTERLRKQIKLSALSSLFDKLKKQEANSKNVGVPDAIYKSQSVVLLEKETRENSKKLLDDYFGFVLEISRNDWFSVFINAIAKRFDPHTSYYAPEEKERFDLNMSGKLEGIGVRLQEKKDFTEIAELISGGPAWRGKQLEAGDLIIKVAQGKAEPVDIVGMRLNDVAKKIKGPKGSEVRLTVKKVDGSIVVVPIIRDVVEMEEIYVKSAIVQKGELKYGVIYLPKFYIDFENKNGRNAGKDIALEVERLKESEVDGIILDVRDDGGGSLSTVVDIAGLFIDEGPIVQIKSVGRKKEVLYDKNKQIAWDGPLVIMINSFSASASEILAAAIQDYKRGVIIGSKQSFGKGTVQNIVDLNQYVRNNTLGDLGALKTTIQKFYRINGGSTQLEGVSSDVVMPDRYSYLKRGERDVENAMPWDKIDATEFSVWQDNSKFSEAILKSRERIENSEKFKLIDEYAQWISQRSKENSFSLNFDKYKALQSTIELKTKKYKPITLYKNNFEFLSLPYEVAETKIDLNLKEKRDQWHESLSKDIYIEEALNILDDLQIEMSSRERRKLRKERLKNSGF